MPTDGAVLVAFAVVMVALSIGAGRIVADWRRGRRRTR